MRVLWITLLLIAGCASAPAPRAELSSGASRTLGADVANYVATALPPDATAVWIAPPHRAKKSTWLPLDEAVAGALRELGYAVAEQREPMSGAVAVDYRVSAADSDAVLIITVAQQEATRYYRVTPDGSDVVPASAFTVRLP